MGTINIAIDGPAGAGKSTIAKLVAKKLDIIYVDTGALYRALSVCTLTGGADPKDEAMVEKVCSKASVDLTFVDGIQHVLLNGEDVTEKLRDEATGNTASIISAYPFIREKLLSLQRNLAKDYDVVMDGRDIGSNVLPDAGLKIYLSASVEKRAKRRFDELVSKNEPADIETIKADIEKRDYQDKTREIAPLVKAEEAVYVDTSDMNIDEVTNHIMGLIKERFDR